MEPIVALAFIGLAMVVCMLWSSVRELEGRLNDMGAYIENRFESNRRMHEIIIRKIEGDKEWKD